MLNEIKERLIELPDKISNKELELMNKTNEIEDIELKIKLLEQNVYNEVEDQLDEEKKKVYSNKEKRDFETKKRLGVNISFIGLVNDLKDKKRDVETNKILISMLKRKFAASLILGRLDE